MFRKFNLLHIMLIIGIVFMAAYLGTIGASRIWANIHESEITEYQGTVFNAYSITTINPFIKTSQWETETAVIAFLENNEIVSVEVYDYSDAKYPEGSKISVYEWNGKYAMRPYNLFMPVSLEKAMSILMFIGIAFIVLFIDLRFVIPFQFKD
ncbi:MAG: hypothetical protein MJ098_07060 [Saccharofermentans sp.]|nr:hypothetical protein [Saccharofermentans sp.]